MRAHILLGFLYLFAQEDRIRTLPQKVSTFHTITGRVIDRETGENLAGVLVLQSDSTGVITHPDGDFSLRMDSFPGYLTFRMIGYQSVRVKVEKPHFLIVALPPTYIQTQEVIIEDQADKTTEVGTLILQKKAATITDVLASSTILSQSSYLTTPLALSRMPGVFFSDEIYLSIRGSFERYNLILFNNAVLPSLEPQRQLFDIHTLPAPFITRLELYKAATADMVSAFSGGQVQIQTWDFPSENFTIANYTLGYNTRTTFRKLLYYPHKRILGGLISQLPDIKEKLPPPEVLMDLNLSQRTALSRNIDNHWHATSYFTPPNQLFTFQKGRQWKKASFAQGIFVGIHARDWHTDTQWEYQTREFYDDSLGYSPVSDEGGGPYSTHQKSLSAMVGGFTTLGKHQWKYNYYAYRDVTQLVYFAQGSYFNPYQAEEGQTRYLYATMGYYHQSIHSGQIEGLHALGKLKLGYNAFFTRLYRFLPSFRPMNYAYDSLSGEYKLERLEEDYLLYATWIRYRAVTHAGGGQIHLTWQVTPSFSIKGGFFTYVAQQKFHQRMLYFYPDTAGGLRDSSRLLWTQRDLLYAPDNMGPGGFLLWEYYRPDLSFISLQKEYAPFLLVQYHKERFYFNAGLRYEQLPQRSYHRDAITDTTWHDTRESFFLPSISVRYAISERSQLRLAWWHSFSRPTLREIAGSFFFDLNNTIFWLGNPSLQTSLLYNGEIRYEFFPAPRSFLAVSVYGKSIRNLIENAASATAIAGALTYLPVNRPWGAILGAEVESRYYLSSKLVLYGNLSLARSKAYEASPFATLTQKGRPLQGQASYIVNSGLIYRPTARWEVAAFYQTRSKAIAITGFEITDSSTGKTQTYLDQWDIGRHVVDLQLAYLVGPWRIQISSLNLLAKWQPITQTQIYDLENFRYVPSRDGFGNKKTYAPHFLFTYSVR
ncbi:MAG: carboxypeptidase-like regulatory domain-containing protein [Bacteroidia bacterium]